jgi:hypothetical protein
MEEEKKKRRGINFSANADHNTTIMILTFVCERCVGSNHEFSLNSH